MSAPDPIVHRHEVVVVGSGSAGLAQVRELRAGGIDDVVVVEKVASARWDEESRTWTVRTPQGDLRVCRFLVDGDGVGRDAVDRLDVTGRDGRTLRGTWAEHGTVTHLGITVADFPNLFLLLDPHPGAHTGPGRRRAVDVAIQRRTRYVRRAIETVRLLGMSGLDVRAEVQQRSAAGVDRTLRPRSTVRSRFAPGRFDPEDFEFFGRAADAARAEPGPGHEGGRVSRVTPADQALLHDGGDEDAVAPVEPTAGEAPPTSRVR